MPVQLTLEPGAERLRAVTCSSCGALLPMHDSIEAMLLKLTQLARFGLDAEGRPLLTPAHTDS